MQKTFQGVKTISLFSTPRQRSCAKHYLTQKVPKCICSRMHPGSFAAPRFTQTWIVGSQVSFMTSPYPFPFWYERGRIRDGVSHAMILITLVGSRLTILNSHWLGWRMLGRFSSGHRLDLFELHVKVFWQADSTRPIDTLVWRCWARCCPAIISLRLYSHRLLRV